MGKAFPNDTPVVVRRLGNMAPGDYRGTVRGIYGGTHEEPGAYIVEMIDRMPGQPDYSCVVFVSQCVDRADPLPHQAEKDRVIEHACELFGVEAGLEWLTRRARALGGEKPNDMLATPEGCKMVDTLICQIDYGVYV